jgi:hypothetical protein
MKVMERSCLRVLKIVYRSSVFLNRARFFYGLYITSSLTPHREFWFKS